MGSGHGINDHKNKNNVSTVALVQRSFFCSNGEATMTLSVTCPNCDKTINAEDKFAGKSVVCPGCGHALEIPKAQPTPSLEPPPAPPPEPPPAPPPKAPPRQESAPIPDLTVSPSKKTTKFPQFSRWMKITAILLVVACFVGATTCMLWPFDAVESFHQFARKKYENYQQESAEPSVIDLGTPVRSFSFKELNRPWCKVWRETDGASFEIDVEKTMSEMYPYTGTLKFSEVIHFSERFESKEEAQACEEYAFRKNRSIIASFKFIKGEGTWEPTQRINDLADSRIRYPFEDENLLAWNAKLPREKTGFQKPDLRTAKEKAIIKVVSLQKIIAIEQKNIDLANWVLENAKVRHEQLHAIVQFAEQRFGAMTAIEQKHTLRIARCVKAGENLNRQETAWLGKFPGLYGGRIILHGTPLGGEITAQIKSRAEAGGFEQLLEMSGILNEISFEDQEIAAWRDKVDGHRKVIIDLTANVEATLEALEEKIWNNRG